MKELFQQILTQITVYGAKIPIILIFVLVGWILIGFAKKATLMALKRAKVEPALMNLLVSVIGFIGWITIAATVFGILGLTQVSIAFSGSIALIAMGLASSASGIVGDLLAGIYLIADPDFKVGARVKIGNVEGVVISMDIRKTKIRDKDGNIQVLPNKAIDAATYNICGRDGV